MATLDLDYCRIPVASIDPVTPMNSEIGTGSWEGIEEGTETRQVESISPSQRDEIDEDYQTSKFTLSLSSISPPGHIILDFWTFLVAYPIG
jgi:hypothetical protein